MSLLNLKGFHVISQQEHESHLAITPSLLVGVKWKTQALCAATNSEG